MLEKILAVAKIFSSLNTAMPKTVNIASHFSTFRSNIPGNKLLQTFVPLVNPTCGMKVKGRVRRRCKSCYLVYRDERAYIMCKEHPRHKQMAMKAKPHNTWILTHATQSPVRPW